MINSVNTANSRLSKLRIIISSYWCVLVKYFLSFPKHLSNMFSLAVSKLLYGPTPTTNQSLTWPVVCDVSHPPQTPPAALERHVDQVRFYLCTRLPSHFSGRVVRSTLPSWTLISVGFSLERPSGTFLHVYLLASDPYYSQSH